MLILGREVGQSVEIVANGVYLRVALIRGGSQPRIGIEAQKEVAVYRTELVNEKREPGETTSECASRLYAAGERFDAKGQRVNIRA